MRPLWTDYFLDMAEAVAKRGTCPRLSVGSIIVDPQNGIVATGYNGSPRGLPHCLEVGCLEIHGRCERTIHSEVNALLQAGRSGSSVVGCSLYVTHRPCYRCMLLLIQAGIKVIFYRQEYKSDNEQLVWDTVGQAGVMLRHLERKEPLPSANSVSMANLVARQIELAKRREPNG
jgi:dCMP deaminase